MITTRECGKKCGGDTLREHDQYGEYIKCLTCGWVGYPSQQDSTKMEVSMNEEQETLVDNVKD